MSSPQAALWGVHNLQQPAFALALKHRLKIAYGVDDDPEFVSKEFGALLHGGMTPLGGDPSRDASGG